MNMDQIYTVDEYYDGPVCGVADLNGEPHYYECIFDDRNDEYSKNYRLSPISKSTFLLVQEQWAIWLRWNEAFEKGKVEASTHPALPQDEERNSEIEVLTSTEKSINERDHHIKLAQFVVPQKPGWASHWYVEWKPSIT